MTRRALVISAGLFFALTLAAIPIGPRAITFSEPLPSRLSDQEFWKLSADLSEPDGYFQSDNLLSNEVFLQYVIPELITIAKPGRVYMGVGPEQNFTYIASLKPSVAFIVDVRRGNLHLHLMYKALFEMSADRVEFVSRLFSKPLPKGLKPSSTAQEIFAAFWDPEVETKETLYNANLKAMRELLVTKHGFPLSDSDWQGITSVYQAFFWFGPSIQYSSSGSMSGRGGRAYPTYADLMVATDAKSVARGYLASEENFAVLKELHAKNMLVPIVGNFGGPKAIRAVGRYLKEHGAIVSAFYLSNVEDYLVRGGMWQDFCGNVAALPLDASSTFIRSVRTGGFGPGPGLSSQLGNMLSEVKGCGAAPARYRNARPR